jgi:hypothetical protein
MRTSCRSLLPCWGPKFLRVVFSVLFAAPAVLVAGCGGGSAGGTGGGGTNPGSFTLSLSASTLTLSSSASQTVTVTASGVNGFSGSINVTLSGLPAGVTASPSTFALSAAGSQQVQLTQNSSAVTSTSTVMVLGSSGTLSAQAQFTLTVQAPPGLSLTLLPASFSSDPGGSQIVEAAVGGFGGVTGNVTGSVTGLPAGVTVVQPTFSAPINSDIILDFDVSSTATTSGVATVTITSGTLTASADLPITITTAPDFVLSSGIYTALVVYQSATATFNVTAAPHNGFNSPIAVSFAGIPTGVTFSPSTFSLTPGQSQTITVATTFSAVPNSNSTTNITMTGTGGGIAHQSQFAFDVIQAYLNLNIQPTALTVPAGSTNHFDTSYSTATNSVGTVSVTLSNIPSGITLSPSSYTAPSAGAARTIFVEASSTAVGGNITMTATYGPITQIASLALTVGTPEAITPVPLSTADQLVPRDALTPYTSFPEPNYLLYHAASNRFFSTDAYLNQLNVVDASTHTLKATLSIPGAFGIDQAPNGSVLYIGTTLGDIYLVDPINLVILKRIPSSSISPYGFTANAVYALANGDLLLEQYFLVPGYSWVDGNGPLAVWNPSTNVINFLGQSNYQSGALPLTPSCLSTVENVILTNNRSRVLLLPVLTSEGSSDMCSLDPIAGTWNWSPQMSGGSNSAFTSFAVTSDGNTLVTYDGFDIYVLDATTLTLKTSFPVLTSQALLNYPVLFLSVDNSSVFLQDPNGADVMDVYNLASGKMTGWIPETNISGIGSYSTSAPLYQGITPSGLAAGVVQGGGIGLLDTTAVHPLPIGSRFSQTELDVPYGPVTGGTASSWQPNEFGVSPPPLGSVYFGANAASGLDDNSFEGMIAAVSPAGAPRPVDVRTFSSDGGSQFLPQAFSYGPSLLETVTSYATAEGGGSASLYGFGFGPQIYAASSPALSNLQVTIGGSPAVVNSYNPDPYGSNYFSFPPFPTNALVYAVPSGVAGTTATIEVSNTSGSTTSSTPLSYLPAVQQYSVDGQLIDGVYDPKRDVYYFTDTAQIRVFSLTKGAWQTPIPIPVPANAYAPQRLWGIALSPDGSKLAVADAGAVAIYILNPDQPSSIQSFALAPQIGYYAQSEDPTGIAILNNGTVYFATTDLVGDGSSFLMNLNPSTGIIGIVAGYTLADLSPGDTYGRLALSVDGERIYTSDEGLAAYYDIPSGQLVLAPVADYDSGQGSDEVVLSANQTRLFCDGFFADSNLNNIGYQALDIAESVDAQYVYGAALSADGSLFFQPGTQAIDVFDGNTGSFRARISLPVPLSANYRALVSNNQDSRLVAITGTTGNGIAVIDLNSIPEPIHPSYLSMMPAPVSALARTRPVTSTAFAAGKLRNHSTVMPNIQRRRTSLIRPSVRIPYVSLGAGASR